MWANLEQYLIAAAGSWWFLAAVVGVAWLDGFFPPIPAETVIIAGASVFAAGHQWDRVALLALAGAIGAALGDNTAYWIGRILQPSKWAVFTRGKGAAAYQWAERGFRKRGAPLLFAARYIPVGRVAVNVVAGSTRFEYRRFVAFDTGASAMWGVYSAGIGAAGGSMVRDHPLIAMGVGLVLGVAIGGIVQKTLGNRLGAAK